MKVKSNMITSLIERIFPAVISITTLLVAFKYNFRIDYLEDYKDLLTNTISFASILLGVIMTLVGLLLGYANKSVVRRIKSRNADELLIKYFIFPIIYGFIIVILSLILPIIFNEKEITNQTILSIISLSWVFGCSYFITATSRIMILMLMILKEVFAEDVKAEDSNENSVKKLKVDECVFDDNNF